MALKRINKVRGGRRAFVSLDDAAGRCRAPLSGRTPLNDLSSLSLVELVREAVCASAGEIAAWAALAATSPSPTATIVIRRAEMAAAHRAHSRAARTVPRRPAPAGLDRRWQWEWSRMDFVCSCSARFPEVTRPHRATYDGEHASSTCRLFSQSLPGCSSLIFCAGLYTVQISRGARDYAFAVACCESTICI